MTATPTPVSEPAQALYGDESEVVCFSDSSADFALSVVGLNEKTIQVYDARMRDWGASVLPRSYERWARRLTEIDPRFEELSNLTISVGVARNAIGTARSDGISVDQGNFLLGVVVAYSLAKIDTGQVPAQARDAWFDYIIDSVALQDPLAMLGNTKELDAFMRTPTGDPEFATAFWGRFNAWIALTALHELAHIYLRHAERWKRKFATVSTREPSSMSQAQLAFSRQLELDADAMALELYMGKLGYEPGHILPTWIMLNAARSEGLRKKGILVYPTHPDPEERGTGLMSKWSKLRSDGPEVWQGIRDHLVGGIRNIRQKLRAGQMREVPALRGTRPPEISINIERWMLRTSQLDVFMQSSSANNDP